jgi:hypothetical protein
VKHAELFLAELASRWSERPVALNILGATALAVQVEFTRGTRDAFGCDETEVELPDWIDR